MKYQKQTKIFIVLVIVLITVFDVFVLSSDGGGTASSISYVLMNWSYRHPVLPFTIGFVMGHLFWRIGVPPKKEDPPS